MNNDAKVAYSGLLSVSLVEGRFSADTESKLAMLAYFLEDEATEGGDFRAMIDEIMKVAPRGYGRVLAYLRELNRNLATDPQADQREYARKIIRARDESA